MANLQFSCLRQLHLSRLYNKTLKIVTIYIQTVTGSVRQTVCQWRVNCQRYHHWYLYLNLQDRGEREALKILNDILIFPRLKIREKTLCFRNFSLRAKWILRDLFYYILRLEVERTGQSVYYFFLQATHELSIIFWLIKPRRSKYLNVVPTSKCSAIRYK